MKCFLIKNMNSSHSNFEENTHATIAMWRNTNKTTYPKMYLDNFIKLTYKNSVQNYRNSE